MGIRVKTIVMAVVFVVCLLMIILGQRNVGYQGLFVELIGLVGLLAVLFAYNRDHK